MTTGNENHSTALIVEVALDKIDLQAPYQSMVPLVAYRGAPEEVGEAVRAWAKVRAYDSLARAIDTALDGVPPESGFSIVINKPHSIILRVKWPWAPEAFRL